jgi:hypothetical protein
MLLFDKVLTLDPINDAIFVGSNLKNCFEVFKGNSFYA